MARGGRGGYQPPRRPAAVSGPGALSARTDGGPSVEYQGLPYGDNKAVNDQASSAPLAQAGASRARTSPRPTSPNGPSDVFGPTSRPGEAPTEGIPWGPGGDGVSAPQVGAADRIDLMVREAYRLTRSPHLVRLLERVAR